MEVFGIIGMSLGVFGLLAFLQVSQQQKELSEIKKALEESGIMKTEKSNEEEESAGS